LLDERIDERHDGGRVRRVISPCTSCGVDCARTHPGGGRPFRSAAALLVLATAIASPAAAAAASSQCAPTERILFSCDIGRKVVSVCASPELTTDRGWVQYRFGPLGARELAYPATDSDWRKATRGGVLSFSGGGGAWLAFARGAYRYVVYTAIGKGWGEKAGVEVRKDGKRVAALRCEDREISELGPDLFANAGIADDPHEFDLPP
jgi:hypothetical protein